MPQVIQVKSLHPGFDTLHKRFGSNSLCPVYGAGCVKKPQAMFVFINPTAKNISAHPKWRGMRAPWLGTKQVWKLFYAISGLSKHEFAKTQTLKPSKWTPKFCTKLYQNIAEHKFYITNLAKCTQNTAKPISTNALRAYLPLLLKEISIIQPKNIIVFGNQISSLILGFPVSVKNYSGAKYEKLSINGKSYKVFPVYYPVGQGMRNLPKAVKRIKKILYLSDF
jgi:DNA polymerase